MRPPDPLVVPILKESLDFSIERLSRPPFRLACRFSGSGSVSDCPTTLNRVETANTAGWGGPANGRTVRLHPWTITDHRFREAVCEPLPALSAFAHRLWDTTV